MKKFSLVTIAFILGISCYSQISYKSEIRPSNSYVQPFDLSIMEKVNAQKQRQYNQNAEALETRFVNDAKLFDYLNELNRALFINEYNRLIKINDTYDLSDGNVVRYLMKGLTKLESAIDFALKNPTLQFPPDYFK